MRTCVTGTKVDSFSSHYPGVSTDARNVRGMRAGVRTGTRGSKVGVRVQEQVEGRESMYRLGKGKCKGC